MSNPKIDFNHISSFGYYLFNSTIIKQYAPNYKKIGKIHRDSLGWYVQFKDIDERYNITLGVIKKRKSFICVKDLKDCVYYLNNNATEYIQSLINENILENNSSSSQELPKPYSLDDNKVVNTAGFLNRVANYVNQLSSLSKSIPNKVYNVQILSNVFDVSETSWRLGLINIKPINEFFDSLTFEFDNVYILCHGSSVLHYNDNPPILELNGNIIYMNGYGVSALNNCVQFLTNDDDCYIYLPKSIVEQKLSPVNQFFHRYCYRSYKNAKEAINKMQYDDFYNRKESTEKRLHKTYKAINKLERERNDYIKATIAKYDKEIELKKLKYEQLSNELDLLKCDFEKLRDEEVI